MGQEVRVVGKRVKAGSVRFEIDRSLTGMAHENYLSPEVAEGDRPTDVLAARLFATGHVSAVHIFTNLITVTLRDHGGTTVQEPDDSVLADIDLVVRELFIHFHPGVLPTAVVDSADA